MNELQSKHIVIALRRAKRVLECDRAEIARLERELAEAREAEAKTRQSIAELSVGLPAEEVQRPADPPAPPMSNAAGTLGVGLGAGVGLATALGNGRRVA